MEMKLTFKDVIKYLEKTKNINRLPDEDKIYKEIAGNEDYNDDYLSYWDRDIEIIINDGTKVKLTHNECINNNEHIAFYYIEDIDTYICAECLTKYKYPYKIYEDKLIPVNWSEEGIRVYLKRGIEYWKEFNESIKYDNSDYSYVSCCSNCIDGECIYEQYGYDSNINDCKNYEE